MNLCPSCVCSNRSHQRRSAFPAIRQQPPPEICTFPTSLPRSPRATPEWKVEQDDCVRPTQPYLDGVVGSQVAIHDPLHRRGELLLYLYPLLGRCCLEPLTPENFVQLDYRQPSDLTQFPGERRLTRCSASKYDYALHFSRLLELALKAEGDLRSGLLATKSASSQTAPDASS
jgi:hypothetical protein